MHYHTFWPFGGHHSSFRWAPVPLQNSKQNPLSWTQGVGRFCNFNWNRHSSWKRYEIGWDRLIFTMDHYIGSISVLVGSDDLEWFWKMGCKRPILCGGSTYIQLWITKFGMITHLGSPGHVYTMSCMIPIPRGDTPAPPQFFVTYIWYSNQIFHSDQTSIGEKFSVLTMSPTLAKIFGKQMLMRGLLVVANLLVAYMHPCMHAIPFQQTFL